MIRTNVKILGLSEVRWSGKGHFQSGDFKIFFSGQETTRAKGVAIICSNEIAQTVLGYNPVSDRIISIRLQGKPLNMTFIQVYARTTAATESDVEDFYSFLQQTIDNTPKGDMTIIVGDMNAKIGECEASQTNRKFGLGIRNEAGERLIEFCGTNDLKIMNSFFKQPKRRQYTWTSPDGRHRNQIDYVMCGGRWRSAIQSTHTLLGADCGSDHELLVADVRLKLRKLKKAFKI